MDTRESIKGFTSHEAAQEAQGLLDGFVWSPTYLVLHAALYIFAMPSAHAGARYAYLYSTRDGCTLRAEWARTEFRPTGGASGAGPAFASGPSRPPAFAPALAWGGGGCIGACGGGGKGKAFAPWGGAKGSAKGGRYTTGGRRTLHFTNLPPVEESECGEFLEAALRIAPQRIASCCTLSITHSELCTRSSNATCCPTLLIVLRPTPTIRRRTHQVNGQRATEATKRRAKLHHSSSLPITLWDQSLVWCSSAVAPVAPWGYM